MAQQPRSRITAAINDSERATIHGTHPMRAQASDDAGAVESGAKISGISMVFAPSATQQADLDALLAAQQDPSSPQYHQWLTPEQFGARFGMSDTDLAKAQAWLQGQGFTVDGVARARNRITFSGTAGQVASAFGAPLHYYRNGTETNFAPSADISVPAALADTVATVRNLSTFRPRPHTVRPQPRYTSSLSQSVHLTPADLATIYDIKPAYSAGYNGTGQSIAVVGQSAVALSDITNFQNAAGLAVKAPTVVLQPGSGSSTIYKGDESESDLDLEYSGGVAPGASIYFVYTGNNQNYGVFDALTYAVDNKVAQIISDSYGACEPAESTYQSLNLVLAQAAAQGQTVVAAAGDDGSEDCYGVSGLSAAQQGVVAVDFPASSPYVTGIGGTEFPAADLTAGAYWASAPSSDVISSALSYIPETVWNDDSASAGLGAGAGGASIYFQRPTWQAGVPGIPSGSYRLVPDVSFAASAENPGYLFCSSDTSVWFQGQVSSCTSGFRDSSSQDLTFDGGTSFGAPIFSGMVAIINQVKAPSGQGLVNPTLYTLASNAGTYAAAFHDIRVGGNQCTAGTQYCTTATAAVYAAGTGYDEASGLGSVDFYNLLTAWPGSTVSTLAATTTTVTAATTTPALNASDVVTITVAPSVTSSTVPTGTVNLTVDGAVVNGSLALTNGTATYTFSSSQSGAHVIVATYSGNGVYATSSGTLTLTIPMAAPTGAFSIGATNLSIAAGNSGASTVSVTPNGGYTGTVKWTLTSSPTLANSCFNIGNVTVSGTTAATTTLTIYTSAGSCTTAQPLNARGLQKIADAGHKPQAPGRESHRGPSGISLAGLLAGLLFAGWGGRRARNLRPLLAVAVLAVLGLGLSGCGDSGGATNPTTTQNATPGTYTLTLTGTDTTTSTITASTNLTLTVQ